VTDMSPTEPCLGVGCRRTDGTHADTCYRSPVQEEKLKKRWALEVSYNNMLVEFCKSRKLEFSTHSGHGFYITAAIGGVEFMLDPTPDDLRRSPPDIVRVRNDETHHYDKPTFIEDVFLSQDGWEHDLEVLLCIGVIGR